MYVTLIRPPSLITKGQISLTVIPPIGLGYIASTLLQARHRVEVIDGVGEKVFQLNPYKKSIYIHGLTNEEIIERISPKTELIGISIMFSQEWPYAKELIKKLRQELPKTPIVLGGEHVTALPEYILETTPEVDYCILGEGEETILDLNRLIHAKEKCIVISGIAYRLNKRIINNGLRPRIKHIDLIPPPAWELFPINNYLDNGLCSGAFKGRTMPIIFSRGCPYECTFCSNPSMWTQRWIVRNPEKVLEEIKNLIAKYRVENFECCDSTAIIRKDWIIEFARLIIENNLDIAWQFPSGTRTEPLDAEVCELLYQSGCKNLVYAPESGSPATLRRIKKKICLDNVKKTIKAAIRKKINVRVNLVLGFPGDTHKDILQTFLFIFHLARIGVYDITHFIFTPYPGSLLFRELKKSRKIKELNEEYFLNLLSVIDLKKTISYTENIALKQLSFYRIFSLIWFYSWMFLFRPWRLLIMMKNILRKKQESRIETVIKMYFKNKISTKALTNV